MSISEVSITASELSKESPITEDGLIELTKRFDEELLDSEQLINYLLLNLQKKSSKHKFIVQTVDIKSQVSINMDLNLVSRSGVLWDHNRDGYISLKVKIEENEIGSSKLEKELEKHDRCKASETLVLVHSDTEDVNNDEDVNHEEIDVNNDTEDGKEGKDIAEGTCERNNKEEEEEEEETKGLKLFLVTVYWLFSA